MLHISQKNKWIQVESVTGADEHPHTQYECGLRPARKQEWWHWKWAKMKLYESSMKQHLRICNPLFVAFFLQYIPFSLRWRVLYAGITGVTEHENKKTSQFTKPCKDDSQNQNSKYHKRWCYFCITSPKSHSAAKVTSSSVIFAVLVLQVVLTSLCKLWSFLIFIFAVFEQKILSVFNMADLRYL